MSPNPVQDHVPPVQDDEVTHIEDIPKILNTVLKDYYWPGAYCPRLPKHRQMGRPRPPLPLPLRGGNRPDKFPHLSLRCPVVFLSSKSVRNAK